MNEEKKEGKDEIELGVRVRHGIVPASLLIPGRKLVRDQMVTWDAYCDAQQGISQSGRTESHTAALQTFPSRWAGL